MIRKSFFFVLTVAVAGMMGHQLAWHPEILGGANIGKSMFALLAIVAAFAFLAWAAVKPKGWKPLAAFALGLVAAWLGGPLWGVIGWGAIGLLGLSLAVLAVLFAGTVLDGRPQAGKVRQWLKDHL